MLALMGPALIGVSAGQINLLLNTIFASRLQTGSVSWLYYADRLMEFPTGLLGAALGTILLPSLAKAHAERSADEYSGLLDWGLRLTFLLAVPAAIALAVLATPLIATLFQHGEFGTRDLAMTRQALVAYSVGLLGLILVKILAPGFYGRQEIRTPVKIAFAAVAATQAMNVLFTLVLPLAHAGLALAIGLGACLNAALLYRGLRGREIFRPLPGWGAFLLKVAAAAGAMAVVLALAAGPSAWWAAADWRLRAAALAGLVALGAAVYFGALWALGLRARDFARR
jgi:putative peptidoglycan lipid II flippase